MKTEFQPYFYGNGLMAPHGSNDILYLAEFCLLTDYSEVSSTTVYQALQSWSRRDFIDSSFLSHDNHTAIVTLSEYYNFAWHRTNFFSSGWQKRLQPWNLIYYLLLFGGLPKLLGYLLLPILSLKMISDVLFDTYKIINDKSMLTTDGLLLTWLRLHTGKFFLTKIICEFILKLRRRKWSDFFQIYFGSEHPNTLLSLEREKL